MFWPNSISTKDFVGKVIWFVMHGKRKSFIYFSNENSRQKQKAKEVKDSTNHHWKKLYFVILLGRFPLVRKIKKNFGHFFHFIAVQKVISRHIFRRRGAEGPETSKNVSRNHFLNQDKMWKWSNFSKFLLNKCMKTIQVMHQSIFLIFE